MEYLEKSKHLQNQLRELRSEIEVLKVGDKQTELDNLYEEQVRIGENKYSTLRKVSPSRIVLHLIAYQFSFPYIIVFN